KTPALPTPEKGEQAAPAPVENPVTAPSAEPSIPVVDTPAVVEKPVLEETVEIPTPAVNEPAKGPVEAIKPIVEEASAVVQGETPVLEIESGLTPSAARGADIDATPEALIYVSELAEGEKELAASEENKAAATSNKTKQPAYPEDQD